LKALLQRVTRASVSVADEVTGSIGQGLVVLLGVAEGDGEADARYLAEKTVNLRIFADNAGKFNLCALDTRSEILAISQFTLLADSKKGRRPSFTSAAPPNQAEHLFHYYVTQLGTTGLPVATGRFGAHMMVEIHNDGPVTILLDSRDRL